MEVVPLDPVGSDMRRLDAKRAENSPIEALGGGEIRDMDRDVVEHRLTIASALRVAARKPPSASREIHESASRRDRQAICGSSPQR